MLKQLDHHRGLVTALAIALLLAAQLVGCEIRTAGLIAPQQRVGVEQFTTEAQLIEQQLADRRDELVERFERFNDDVAAFESAVASRTTDLQQQFALREQIVMQVGGLAAQAADGSLHPVSAVSTLLSLIAFASAGGLIADNVRKDRVIKTLKKPSTA